jgi:hypothetical protein
LDVARIGWDPQNQQKFNRLGRLAFKDMSAPDFDLAKYKKGRRKIVTGRFS